MKIIIYFTLIIGTINCYCQDISVDRNGDTVFSFYAADKPQISLSSGDNSLRLNFMKTLIKRNILLAVPPFPQTVTKNYGISFSGKLFTTDKYLFLDNLSSLRPAYQLDLGIQKTLDNLNMDNIPTIAKAWGIKYYYRKDNLIIYDSLTNIESRKKPVTHGISSHYTFFTNKLIQFSLSAFLEKTWNKKDLLEYQYLDSLNQNKKIIPLGDAVGRIGPYKSVTNYRLRMSAPITPFSNLSNKLTQICLIPFYSFSGKTSGSNNYRLYGFTLNYLGKGTISQDYTFTEGFGIGVDWLKKRLEPAGARIFIFGTINFGK